MENAEKKYRINECLDLLTIKEHRFAMRMIPEILNIAPNTFHNYRSIEIGDKQDIPYEKVKMMEILFELEPGGLQNFELTGISLKAMAKQ